MKIAAVFGSVGPNSPKEYVERMCKAQLACDWHTYSVFEVPGGAIGVVRTSEKFGKIPMFLQSSKGNILAISGVPIKGGKLTPFLHRVVEMSSEDASRALTEMDGAYAALFWNAEEKKAILVTDFMGFQPVYLHKAQAGIAIASEIKAFSVGGVVPVKPDPAGWGGFVIFGNSVGDPTQLSGVSRLRGVQLSYVPEENTLHSASYWQWPDRKPHISVEDVELASLVDCFRIDIESYKEYGIAESTLLMSSGFDSRLLLCLLTEAGIPIKSLSVQQPKHYFGAEGSLGYKVARYFGVSEACIENPLSGLQGEAAVLRYLVMNDVATPGVSLFISKVASHVYGLNGAVWEGFGPGYTVMQLADTDMDSYLNKWGLHPSSASWDAAAGVFSPSFLESVQKNLAKNVQKECEEYGKDDYGVMRFVVKNRALNRTSPNPLKAYANSTIPFMPGLSKGLWDKTSQLPPNAVCSSKQLFKRVYQEFFPKALKLPFCSEKGLYTADGRFNFSVSVTNLFYDLAYKWERRHKLPYIGKYIGKKIARNSVPNEVNFQEIVLDNLVSDTTYLDLSKVEALLTQETLSPQQQKSKTLLFYWALWHLVMNGEISSENCQDFLQKHIR